MDLAERIKEAGEYLEVRVLPDGTIIALGDLLFIRAIMIDCDESGYDKRFCFEDRTLAREEFNKLQTGDDVPQGFIAKRPKDR